MRVACIVEGHGETLAVPVLLRRLAGSLCPGLHLDVEPPIRINKSQLMKPGELERAVELAARRTSQGEAIIVLLDADDDCPKELAPRLLERARRTRRDRNLSVVIAKAEFESWFLAAARSLASHRGLPTPLSPPRDAEGVRDAKGWLADRMAGGGGYSETIHQPSFADRFDLNEARSAPSFDKLCRDFIRLFCPG